MPTLVTVEDRTPWQWNVGAGYAAGARLGLDARISHLNLFGSAERVDLQGRVSRIERTAKAAFTLSDAWHPALLLSVQAGHQEIDERAFFVRSRGGQAAATWQWSSAVSSTVAYAVAREESDVDPSLDPLLGLEDGVLSAWSVDLDHQRQTSHGSPGRSLSLHVEQAGGWMAEEIFPRGLERDAGMGHVRAEPSVSFRRTCRRRERPRRDAGDEIRGVQAADRCPVRRGGQRVAGSMDDAVG